MPFIFGLLLALPLVPAARKLGLATGLVDHPRDDPLRVHAEPVPFLGGVAVVTASVAAVFAFGGRMAPAILGAVVLALVVGTVDDRWSLPPLIRFLALLLAGAVVALGGEVVRVAGPGGAVLTALVVASCANAVNMTDGQDGLAGGLAALAALGLGAITGERGMALGLGLAGALSAFLIWNRPPARIFLGNGGAYGVGTMLGVLTVQAAREAPNPWTGLLAAGAVLGVFAFELLFTILRRVLSRRPLIPGDRLHSYDLASTVVESRTRTTLLFWAVGAAVGALGLLIRALPLAGAIAVAAVLAAAGIGAGVGLWSRLRAET